MSEYLSPSGLVVVVGASVVVVVATVVVVVATVVVVGSTANKLTSMDGF